MDYVITTEDGQTIVIEMSKADESKKRLEAYYNALLQYTNDTEDEHTKRAIEYVMDSMDAEEIVDLEKDVANKDEQYVNVVKQSSEDAFNKRMMAYFKGFQQLSEKQKSIADPMREVVEKYKKFDFDALIKEEINGNIFTYKKDKFPIERYRTELEEIGNKTKGNQWTVSEDDGKLVIY